MAEFTIVDNSIWETPASRKEKLGPLAQALVEGNTVFVEDPDSERIFNPYYSIANRKGFRLEVRKIEKEGKTGRIGRFVKKENDNGK